jgi:hypothetical protein
MREEVQIAPMTAMAMAAVAALGTAPQFLRDLGAMTADRKKNKTRTVRVKEGQMTRNTHLFRVRGDVLQPFLPSLFPTLCDITVESYPDDWQAWQSNIHPSHIDLPIVYKSGLFSQ